MREVILGIDPGSRVTGYAVLAEEHGKLIALRCDVLNMAHIKEHSDRLEFIFNNISRVIKSIQPTKCAVETPIYGVDPQAMLKLGRAQAAAILAIKTCGLEAGEYFPKVVKRSITGNGNASKDQVAFMLKKMIQFPEEELPYDATDALAVAWCHLMNNRGVMISNKKTHQNHKKESWKVFVEQHPDRVTGL